MSDGGEFGIVRIAHDLRLDLEVAQTCVGGSHSCVVLEHSNFDGPNEFERAHRLSAQSLARTSENIFLAIESLESSPQNEDRQEHKRTAQDHDCLGPGKVQRGLSSVFLCKIVSVLPAREQQFDADVECEHNDDEDGQSKRGIELLLYPKLE